MDFLTVVCDHKRKEVRPEFKVINSKDLMVRGSDFYAIWDEATGMWSKSEWDVIRLVDNELDEYVNKNREAVDGLSVKYMRLSGSGSIDRWHKYVQKQMRDNFHPLDESIIFDNTPTTKKSYASHRLPYSLSDTPTPAWDEIVSTLYSKENQHKIEWAIGSIVNGGSKKLQKFFVFYGAQGTGKSTILNIVQKLFDGYWVPFESKSLASKSDSFAMEPFKGNPLVAIEHEGKLDRVVDNTRLNSIVSHETMVINEKFRSLYSNRLNCILFIGTNNPVQITDSRSGLIRRLIDINPSNHLIPRDRYDVLYEAVNFELGGIASKCKRIFEENPKYYDKYVPLSMMETTNNIYYFLKEKLDEYRLEDGVTLSSAWADYKTFCADSNVLHPYNKLAFKEELKNYFTSFDDRIKIKGVNTYSWYSGFKTEKFVTKIETSKGPAPTESGWLILGKIPSLFDKVYAHCPAQYAADGVHDVPTMAWGNVQTVLSDIDTSRTHYIKPPKNLICIDFDLKNSTGDKSLKLNLDATEEWPATYGELSKSGQAVHLYYIYDGDISKLSHVYKPGIEIKTFPGKSSLRRRVTLCNDIPINTISCGLPIKEEKVISYDGVKTEKGIRTIIKNCLQKKYEPPSTKPMVDLIAKVLDEAYASGVPYDVTDLKQKILYFASHSSHQADVCLKTVSKMHFKSESEFIPGDALRDELIFYDVEVFPNLFVVVWKAPGRDAVKMINPSPDEISELCKHKLIGFNCRRYDNHIMYARIQGFTNKELYNLSQRIISGDKSAFFGNAYNLSFTDVFDFCDTKQSLKKWEIQMEREPEKLKALGIDLDIKHHELGLPWDQPVEESLWSKVAEYCIDDVVATEATFYYNKGAYEARESLVALANLFAPATKSTENDTTNTLTGRIIFGNNRHPQSEFVYTDLSIQFPGYRYDAFKKSSFYRGEEFGEGGYVFAQKGMYRNVVTFDVSSMHPHSVIALNLFGDRYTKRFKDLVDLRIAIKHKDFDTARKMFDGVLVPFLKDEGQAKSLAQALKIAINSVYGLTAAKFDNLFRDPRNVDNIVAKRGELFMIDLKNEVMALGANVIHIKTDSIKIENPSKEIYDFVMAFGKKYGYEFEVESEYEKICLVNDSTYIAKDKNGTWEAKAAQFKAPYVYKTLFSKEPIGFQDVCETKQVSSALYLDMNEGLLAKAQNLTKAQARGLESDSFEEVEDSLYLVDPNTPLHDYRYIGKVGRFCPIKPSLGGGLLMRSNNDGSYSSVVGSKGYRWLESEYVKKYFGDNWLSAIDQKYYISQVDKAIEAISQYGDFEAFVS